MPRRFGKYWRDNPNEGNWGNTRVQLAPMGGVVRMCEKAGKKIPCPGGGTNHTNDEKYPYPASVFFYQPRFLRNENRRGYDLHWFAGAPGMRGATGQTSRGYANEEGFVTRYRKGGNYFVKLWYDYDENGRFNRRIDSSMVTFNLGRAGRNPAKKYEPMTGNQFARSVRSVDFGLAFPSRSYLSSLGEDQDKYIFERDYDNRALLYKTIVRWEGYKGIGIKNARVVAKWPIPGGMIRHREIKGEISDGFNTEGRKTRDQLAKELLQYPSRVSRRELHIELIRSFDDWTLERHRGIHSVYSGTPKYKPRNNFLLNTVFYLVLHNRNKVSVYLGASDSRQFDISSDILIGSGKIDWYDFDSIAEHVESRVAENKAGLHLRVDAISALTEEKYYKNIAKNIGEDEAEEIEFESDKREFGFYHDILKDRFANNDNRLGFQRMDFFLDENSSAGLFDYETIELQYPGYEPRGQW